MGSLVTKQQVAENIARFQKIAGMTDVALAAAANIAPSALSNYRNCLRRPQPDVIIAIARAFDEAIAKGIRNGTISGQDPRACFPVDLDPTVESQFKVDSSAYLAVVGEVQVLLRQLTNISTEIEEERTALAAELVIHQRRCAMVESQVQEKLLKAQEIERAMSVKLGQIKRQQRQMERLAGFSTGNFANLGQEIS